MSIYNDLGFDDEEHNKKITIEHIFKPDGVDSSIFNPLPGNGNNHLLHLGNYFIA